MTSRLPRLGRRRVSVRRQQRGRHGAYLKARANLAGRRARSGSVMKATKKQTAAPIKHPPNPSNLQGHHHKSKGRWHI